MDFALCLTLDILGSLFNAFFLVHDSENPKFGSLNSRAGVHDHMTCAVRGLCIAAVHAIEIVNSDVNIYQLLVSGFVLS